MSKKIKIDISFKILSRMKCETKLCKNYHWASSDILGYLNSVKLKCVWDDVIVSPNASATWKTVIIASSVLHTGPFSNYLAVKTSFRKITFAGGLLLGTGYAVSCFVTRMEHLLLTMGIISGKMYVYHMRGGTAFPTVLLVRPAKTQIRLRIRAVWSESSLSAEDALNHWLSTDGPA